MSEARAGALGARLKAVADPTRLRMLDLLAQQPGPLCVRDLTARFIQNQPTISHHLRILREAGFIETEKRGIRAYYWATGASRQTLAVLETLS
jgi:ArsR family transcriptional regulator